MSNPAYGHFAEGKSVIHEILQIILNQALSTREVIAETYRVLYGEIAFENAVSSLTDEEDKRNVRINLNLTKNLIEAWRKAPINSSDEYTNIVLAITLYSFLSFMDGIKCIHNSLKKVKL